MPLRIHGARRLAHRVPHPVVEDDGEDRQIEGGRRLMAGNGISEHVGAVSDAGDDEPVTLGELGAESCGHAPAQSAGYRVTEVAVRPRERHDRWVASKLVEEDGVLILLPVEAATDPGV